MVTNYMVPMSNAQFWYVDSCYNGCYNDQQDTYVATLMIMYEDLEGSYFLYAYAVYIGYQAWQCNFVYTSFKKSFFKVHKFFLFTKQYSGHQIFYYSNQFCCALCCVYWRI